MRSKLSSPICVLDDDPSVLKATSRLLISAGREARAFNDPAVFLDYARINQPALAIIDMMMPVMDGLEVQAKLKEVSPSTRVIILTSRDDPAGESRANNAGAFAFFYKPADPEEFLACIKAALVN